MELLIFFFPPSFLSHMFCPRLPRQVGEVSVTSNLSSPRFLLYSRMRRKYFSRCYTFDRLRYLLRVIIHRHTLRGKMHIIAICSYLQKPCLIMLAYLQTHGFELLIYFGRKYDYSILCRRNEVIEQYRNIMALVNEATHSLCFRSKSREFSYAVETKPWFTPNGAPDNKARTS